MQSIETLETAEVFGTESPHGIVPFALMEIGQRSFEIAEDAADESLLFRSGSDLNWMRLERNRENGWTLIASEIVLTDPDAMDHFLQTYLLRLDGEFDAPGVVTLVLLETSFNLRYDESGLWVERGSDWVKADGLGVSSPAISGRKRCHIALLKTFPDLPDRFAIAVRDWSERIAKGSRVKPLL